MVKFRGIEVCVISQFDICRLPEFPFRRNARLSDPFRTGCRGQASAHAPVASCYVPIYPGSQIWFEYTIDGPHPPGAAYFLKLFLDNKHITSWDCTDKHGFHGKMMYNLVHEGNDAVTGTEYVRRQALKFGDECQDSKALGKDRGFMEIKVYRVEHRKRIRDMPAEFGAMTTAGNEGLRLVDSGLIEPSMRARRYKYQLLDPLDVPYAAFRFYYRSYEYLEATGVVPLRGSPTTFSLVSTPNWRTVTPSVSRGNLDEGQNREEDSTNVDSPETPSKSVNDTTFALSAGSPLKGQASPMRQDGTPTKVPTRASGIACSDSHDSLSIKTKDSIEDLQSSVPRSPKSPSKSAQSPKKVSKSAPCDRDRDATPLTPTKSPKSTRQRLQKKLTVSIGGAQFDLDKKSRPLSPFGSGSLLKKTCIPPSAPPAVTEFGPTIEDEVNASLAALKVDGSPPKAACTTTTSAARGGKNLMSFLGRRIANGRSAQA